MAVRIKFDSSHNIIEPTFVLSTRTGDKIGPIPAVEISVSDDFNDSFKLEFKVYKYNNGVKCELWDRITDFALVWCREWDVWFEIGVTLNDNNATVKSISGVSLGEAELSQIVLYEFEANTEDDIARDDYKPTVLYDENDKDASLLDRIMEKAPHYTLSHVDSHIQSLQRTFTFDNTSILDAFNDIAEEIDCIFVINSGTNDSGDIARSISVYDLQSYCIDCTHRDSFQDVCPECGGTNILQGYGDDTSIFVSTENLAEDIQLEVDTGSVKNCFRLEAGDDLMTAAIRSCNPNGSQYIWYISDDVKRDMPSELVDKLEDYDELYDEYVNTHSISLDSSAVSAYNTLINKYVTYRNTLATVTNPIIGYSNLMNVYYDIIDFRLFLSDEFMHTVQMSSTTAAAQAALITSGAMSPVAVQNISTASLSTCSSSALAMAKTLVRPNYQVKVNDGATYSNNVWTGSFKVTNYSDDTDTANSASVSITITGNYENFVLQRVQKLLSEQDDNYDPTTVSEVFKLTYANFVTKLKDYGLATLKIFHDCGQSVLDVLLQLGVANDATWADQNPDLYNEIYLPYYNKLEAVDAEIIVRESEIDTIDTLKKSVETNRNTIQDALNFQEYLGTELWLDFSAYRREDLYSNSNFVSDGLTNTEIFDFAREFIKDAQKDIYKSATLQHSITATLKNLLVMKEFTQILDYFKVGNWIRARVDDVIYRLRLLSYSIEFDSPDDINIEFSDVQRCINGFDDTLSVLDSASSMASSYDFVTRQAKKGYSGNEKLAHWVEDGLAMTKLKIVDDAEYQNMQWDDHGMLFREYLPLTDDYSDKQLKIINRGLYVTDDNWKTSKVGIGDFVYYDPEIDQNVEAYGLIADTIVGKIILGEEVGIYNTEGNVVINQDGMKICADLTYDDSTDTMFKIQRKVIDNTSELGYKIEDLLYLDTDGDLVVNGTLKVFTDGQSSSSSIVDIASGISSEDVDQKINDANALLQQNISNNYYTKSQSDSLISNATSNINSSIASAISNFEIGGRNYISSSTLRWTENSMFALSTGVATKAIGAIRMTDKINVDSGDGYYLSMYGDNLSGTTMLITEYTSNDTFIRSVTNVQPGAISFSNNCAKIGVSLYNYFNAQYQIIEPTTYSNTYSITPPTGAVGYSPIIIGGKSIVMTQLIPNGNFANDVYVAYQSTYSISNNKLTITSQGTGSSVRVCTNNDSRSSVVKGHIYYYRAKAKSSVNTTVRHGFDSNVSSSINVQANTLTIVDALKTATSSGSYSYNYYFNATSTGQTCEYSNSICIDLTKMFGPGNEPTTVEQVRSMFPADYYEYNTGSILNIGCAKIIIKNSNNTITSTLDIPQDIQDLPAYGCSAGSVYNYIDYAEKKYHQCVGVRNFQSGDSSNASYVTDGTTTCYPLSTDVVTDISGLIRAELLYAVEIASGGSVTFAHDTDENYRIPVKTLSKFSYTRVDNATVNRLNSDVSATWLSNGLLKIKLEKGNKATDWTPAPEDATSEASAIAGRTEGLINESEERLINDIANTEERLKRILNTYGEEIGSIKSSINSLNQQGNSISESISQQDKDLRQYTEDMLSDALDSYGVWMSVEDNGVIIGKTQNGSNSAFYTKIDNYEMGFYQNNHKVAYISQQHLCINNATIQDRLVFGDYDKSHFFFSEDSDHGMVITWVENT